MILFFMRKLQKNTYPRNIKDSRNKQNMTTMEQIENKFEEATVIHDDDSGDEEISDSEEKKEEKYRTMKASIAVMLRPNCKISQEQKLKNILKLTGWK